MFDHHRKSPWFAEKYDPAPEFVTLRRRVRKEGWRGRLNTFLHDLESGKFDPDLSEPEADVTSPVKESVEAGEDTKTGGDDDMQFNLDAEDDAGEQEPSRVEANGKSVNDNKRNNRGEEVSVLPEGNQVMIRTIPPDIGRVKLEEVSAVVECIYMNL